MRKALEIKGNPTMKVVHHDLQKDGTISYYNLQLETEVYTKIPARLVESVDEHVHEHEEKE